MNGRPFPKNITPPSLPTRTAPVKLWIFIAVVLMAYLGVRFGLALYTDYLWFDHLDLASVYATQWWARIVVGLAIGLPVTVIFLANAFIARWLSIRNVLFFSDEAFIAQRFVIWGILAFGSVLVWLISTAASTDWLLFMRYFNQHPFNLVDPVFEQDISFYLFTLPVWKTIQTWLIVSLLLGIVGALAVYALAQQNTLAEGRPPVLLPHIQLHLSMLGALIFLTIAWGHWLNLFDLMYSDRGVAFGASYTDINVTMPALWTLVAMATITAFIFILNIFLHKPAASVAAVLVWVIAGGVGLWLVPQVVQRYIVIPNELASEAPYIENNIKFTNIAYGLDTVTEADFGTPLPLTESVATAARNATMLSNIRLWDYRPLQQTYQQIQAIRLYYRFNDVDFDRYIVDGVPRQVAISARELEKGQLQQTWVTQKLQFTHGYGIVANPVNEVTTEGLPKLWIQDLPPRSPVGLEVTRPEVYYGETTDDYVFVNTTEREFNYPSGDQNVYTQYEGTGGVVMDNYLKRLGFAVYLSDMNMLLSNEFTNQSRVMLRRNIQERVQHVAPFLQYDGNPYIVISDEGHLYWIQDAYTSSDLFPYSEPIGRINYIRNSVKVVISAYNGDMTFYVMDDDDPLIKSYMGIFPNLFTPASEMPSWVKRHIRYPESLFSIQSELFRTYHMRDVNVFYNKEDLWQVPKETFSGNTQTLKPYYVILSLPDSEQDEFVLIQPFTPNNKDNLIAWMAARSDGNRYGELIVYRFPKQELVFGPLQIEGRIDQDPEISSQITLWDQGGSEVIRGNLLVLPIENSLLYVEPLYLRAENGQIPELKRVIVATGDQISMAETLGEALIGLYVKADKSNRRDQPERASENEEAPSPIQFDDLDLDTATINQLAEQASLYYEAAQRAQRDGDWAAYGEELENLETILNALVELTNETDTVEQ